MTTRELADEIQRRIEESRLFDQNEMVELLLVAYLARGHILIEGPPGTGKTTTAKLLAHLLAKSFCRIQFTNEMLPSDILGAQIFVAEKNEFRFIKGPIFHDFIVADEINRTPPRTHSALLEAMEERQVTIEGNRYPLSPDFFVVATQNPQDFEGTFPLPEVQIDRFLFKIILGHSGSETEQKVLRAVIQGELPIPFEKLRPITYQRDAIDSEIDSVKVDDSILRYITQILAATRKHEMLVSGSSIRGGIALSRCSRILALIRGRNFVIPDDIKALASVVLRHRVRLGPEARLSGMTEDQIIQSILQKVEFPK